MNQEDGSGNVRLERQVRRKSGPKVRAGWEMFSDPSYYDMWAVREVGDRSFESPRLFHFVFREDAEAFKALLEKSYHAIRA